MNNEALQDAFKDYIHDNLNAINRIKEPPSSAILFSQDEFAIYPERSVIWLSGVGEISVPNLNMNPNAGWLAFTAHSDSETMSMVLGDSESPFTGPGASELPQKDGVVFAIPNGMVNDYMASANDFW